MSAPPRGLSPEEQAAWAKLAATVTPIDPRRVVPSPAAGPGTSPAPPTPKPRPKRAGQSARPTPVSAPVRTAARADTLDGHWDRRLKAGQVAPDITLDLHGHGLDAAYTRLMGGLAQAWAMQARVVLVVAGRSRPVDAADRGSARGAIRAKMLDWLAASEHSSAIAAVRNAHPRHGGGGALYLILRRR